jgi:Tfp pilus assembly protein PilN
MSTNINLLLHTDGESLKQNKIKRLFYFIAVGSLMVVCLIAVTVFVLIKAVNPESIKKQQEEVLAQISQFQNRQVKLLILSNRIETVEKILKTRRDLPKITSGLLAKIPTDLSIDNLEVDSKTVVVSGQSKSLSAIGEFIDNLTDMAHRKEIIKSLTLSSLAFDGDKSTYQISVKSGL